MSTRVNEISRNIYKGVETFYEYDARNIGTVVQMPSSLDNGMTIPVKLMEIPTPAWYPNSFLRSLKRNSYFNMLNPAAYKGDVRDIDSANSGKKSLDFYKESNVGVLENLVHTGVKSIISTASNQIMSITNKIDSVIDGVSNLFSGGDKNTQSLLDYTLLSKDPFLASQPYLLIKGIHITESLRDRLYVIQRLISGATEAISGIVQANIKSKDFKIQNLLDNPLTKDFKEKMINALKSLTGMTDLSGDFTTAISSIISNDKLRLHGFAEVCMDTTLSGTYTMSCKLPFFDNKAPVMASCGGSGSFTTPFTNNTGDFQAWLNKSTGMTTGWTSPIKWSPQGMLSSKTFRPVSYSFEIYNDTLEHVLLNLYFIWSFGALSKPITDTFFIRPPYIFDIEIPGGFRYKYCTLNLKITPVGKLRKISSLKVTDAHGSGMDDFLANLFETTFKYAVNPKAIEYVPDCYTVSVEFDSLLPDLWNYIDSYLHQYSYSPYIGTRLRTKLAEFTYNFRTGS